ncbi:MAG TPA: VWA domain-containing protein [Planctomycetota bacterium]
MILLVLALAQDPRLDAAVRGSDARAVEAALSALEPAKAPRALVAALGRARERLDVLLSTHAVARASAIELDDAVTFDLNPEKAKKRLADAAKARVRETSVRALEGERIYDAIRGAFRGLPSGAAAVVAEEAERSGNWLLKCELYEALGTMRAEGPLLKAMDVEREPVVLATILSGLASERAAWHLDHATWQVRLAAVRALRESKGGVGAVVERLPAADARWRNEACATLGKATGREMPADAWPDWWRRNAEDFRAGRVNAAAESAGPGRTTFYDIPLHSTRVCFVIDRSGSMRENGRFQAARAELLTLLDRLPDGARVNIVFFGGTPSFWAKTTRILDAQARKDATRWIEDQGLESGTDLYRALEKSLGLVGWADSGKLREDGVDTLFVLSDGEATVGRLQDDELIARVIARRARYLRPVIHAVALSSAAPSMRLLADLTGGEYRMK